MASLLDGLVSIVAQEALKYTVLSGTPVVGNLRSVGCIDRMPHGAIAPSRYRSSSDVAGILTGRSECH